MSRYYTQLLPATLVAATLLSSVSWADSPSVQVKAAPVISIEPLKPYVSPIDLITIDADALYASLAKLKSTSLSDEYIKALKMLEWYESDIEAVLMRYTHLLGHTEDKLKLARHTMVQLLEKTNTRVMQEKPGIEKALNRSEKSTSILSAKDVPILSVVDESLFTTAEFLEKSVIDLKAQEVLIEHLVSQEVRLARQIDSLASYKVDVRRYMDKLVSVKDALVITTLDGLNHDKGGLAKLKTIFNDFVNGKGALKWGAD